MYEFKGYFIVNPLYNEECFKPKQLPWWFSFKEDVYGNLIPQSLPWYAKSWGESKIESTDYINFDVPNKPESINHPGLELFRSLIFVDIDSVISAAVERTKLHGKFLGVSINDSGEIVGNYEDGANFKTTIYLVDDISATNKLIGKATKFEETTLNQCNDLTTFDLFKDYCDFL